jgi:predicted nucleotidyltransferase
MHGAGMRSWGNFRRKLRSQPWQTSDFINDTPGHCSWFYFPLTCYFVAYSINSSIFEYIRVIRQAMNETDINKEISTISRQIIQKYKPHKIILFGSAVRGTFGADSDLDFFIIKDDPRPGGERIRDVSGMFKHTVATDILVYTPEEVEQSLKWGDPFIKNILSHGKVIYG